MGWSCRIETSKTIERLQDACVASTGSSNTVELPGGRRYFFELSNREYADGHATGRVFRTINDTQALPRERFSISPEGKVKGPAWLQALAKGGRTLAEQWAQQARRGA